MFDIVVWILLVANSINVHFAFVLVSATRYFLKVVWFICRCLALIEKVWLIKDMINIQSFIFLNFWLFQILILLIFVHWQYFWAIDVTIIVFIFKSYLPTVNLLLGLGFVFVFKWLCSWFSNIGCAFTQWILLICFHWEHHIDIMDLFAVRMFQFSTSAWIWNLEIVAFLNAYLHLAVDTMLIVLGCQGIGYLWVLVDHVGEFFCC